MTEGGHVHIASIDYPAFYVPAFASPDESARFFESVEALTHSSCRRRTKSVLHQAARMLWLSDRMDEVARGRPALQVLFYLIAAEAIAKLVFKFKGKGASRAHVQKFFTQVCDESHRERLGRAFSFSGGVPFVPAMKVVDFLYDVRCDVAHEGRYFGMHLLQSPDTTPTLTEWTPGVHIIAHITAEELRQIILEGAVLGARQVIAVAEKTGDA